ncbi:alpha-amylase [Sporosarcina newyorkensis 2681]|uniref:Alpha-amylase n=1 Tax=Sporosarcina newyorkensis 2681 TaxID=1027292 RepID=F9DY49_9BACL|nr:alpha-amylase family glycosyl hydrolase [Sporosarcina newyorkensis]EGQ19262.1 alpha-amylase [Sporosarcina newyorkensis 2681]
MKVKRWFGLLATLFLLVSTVNPAAVFADEKRTIEDKSIYDLLVDRFNNGNGNNDFDVNARDLSAFNGGDFNGIVERLPHITTMGFTTVSLGPVFEAESYDGNKVLDYTKLDPHFGTADEFVEMISALHDEDLYVIADFPLGGVSANHVWAQNGTLKPVPAADGTIDWDSSDAAVQSALKEAIMEFVDTYKLDGIRLTKIADFDTAFLNEVIQVVKAVNPEGYVLTNEVSDADFDAAPNFEKMEALRKSFVTFDPDSAPLSLFTNDDQGELIQFDELTGPRFTFDIVEARMFPPTRWKLAVTALFSMPGTPIMPYGTEIAVNGEAPPENHQLMNFKTDEELIEFISNLNTLRNQSEAFRNGDFEMLHNEGGFTVFKRSSDDETWIVALNNTTETSSLEIPKEVIGNDKLLRGVLGGDLVREGKDGVFRIVNDREVAEIYIADEDKGFNTPYLIASIMVYVLFFGFLFLVWRKGRQRR